MSVDARAHGWVNPARFGRAHIGAKHGRSTSGITSTERLLVKQQAPVYNQGIIGSCVAETSAYGAVEHLAVRCGAPVHRADRPRLYGRCRQLIGTFREDSGATIGDAMAVLRTGYEVEIDHPAGPFGGRWAEVPPTAPPTNRLFSVEALDFDVDTFLWALELGCCVLVGLQVTDQWNHLSSKAVIDRPEGDVIGGHAVAIVGFDLPSRLWRIRNSWGGEWGEDGFAWLPFEWTRLPWIGEAFAPRSLLYNTGIAF